ncbi:MAG: S-formylglutathione hydrolase [Gammaproteobacteria bacterium]|nr:S-formylglutathione hydrolase [Gammaproteobacteria bacterium]
MITIDETLNLVESHRINKGEQRVYEHSSKILGCTMRFAIYLPCDALDGDKCPVLYFLSGLTCSEQNVIQKSGFQRFAHRYNMIVVCPDTSPRGNDIIDDERYWVGQGAGFYVNATEEPYAKNFRMYDYITKELPQLINSNFPYNGLQSITGHSMGGFGALLIGMKNTDQYQSVSAFSPIVSPRNSEWGIDALEAYFGDNEKAYIENDPCELIKELDSHIPILIDQGDADAFLENNLKTELLEQAAKIANYPIEINMREGYDHSYYFVQSYIMEHFVFHAEYLDAN